MDFAPYFSSKYIKSGSGDPIMQEAYQLRYDVYCVERQYLDAGAYPDCLETDSYDLESAHFHSYNHKRELVGYSRLIAPDLVSRFPWQEHCTALLDGIGLPPLRESAEISRLMVRQDYRRRRGDTLSGVAQPDDAQGNQVERRSRSPQILLTLYRQMYHHSLAQGIRYWYAAMEQPLARSLQLMNFSFMKIGHEADYFGPVTPYVADLRVLEKRLGQSNPALLAWIQRPDGSDS